MDGYFIFVIIGYVAHAVYGRKWFDSKGYPFWAFIVSCAILGAVGGLLRSSVGGGAVGALAELTFIAIVILNYVVQLKRGK